MAVALDSSVVDETVGTTTVMIAFGSGSGSCGLLGNELLEVLCCSTTLLDFGEKAASVGQELGRTVGDARRSLSSKVTRARTLERRMSIPREERGTQIPTGMCLKSR